jgi:hypothetical protein
MKIDLSLNKKKYNNKQTIIIGLLVLMLLVLILAPIFLLINYKINSLEENKKSLRNIDTKLMEIQQKQMNLEEQLMDLNRVDKRYNKKFISVNIYLLSHIIDKNIIFKSLNYESNNIFIKGESSEKGSIFNTVTELNKSKLIEEINLENFIKNDDKFTFNLSYKIKQNIRGIEEEEYNEFIEEIQN